MAIFEFAASNLMMVQIVIDINAIVRIKSMPISFEKLWKIYTIVFIAVTGYALEFITTKLKI